MNYFDSDYNTRRKMETEYKINVRNIDNSVNKATQEDRVKMDTYFLNMTNTTETCLRDENCRKYIKDTMTNQSNKKTNLKTNIINNSSYNRYSGNKINPNINSDKLVHYSRMYGIGNVAPNYKVDVDNDVAPNFKVDVDNKFGANLKVNRSNKPSLYSDGNYSELPNLKVNRSNKPSLYSDGNYSELPNLKVKHGVNISGPNPRIR